MKGRIFGRIGMLLVGFFLSAACYCQKDFDRLLALDKDIMPDSVWSWYQTKVRRLDSAQALKILADLEKLAQKKGDRSLQSAALFHSGQYYINRLKDTHPATGYIRQAIRIAEEAGLKIQEAIYMHHLGYFYLEVDGRHVDGLLYILQSFEKMSAIGLDRFPRVSTYLLNIGSAYYHLGNYEESRKYLWMARHFLPADRADDQHIENTLGLACSGLGMDDSALIYYRRSLSISERTKDTIWQGISYGNIGAIYLKRKMYDSAAYFFERNYRFGDPVLDTTSTIGVINALAEVSLARSNADSALHQLRFAEALLKPWLGRGHYYRQAYLYGTMAKAFASKGQYEKAYYYQSLAREIADSTARKNDALQYVKVQQQLELEKQMSQLQLLHAAKRTETIKSRFLWSAIASLLCILFLVDNRRKLKARKDKEITLRKEQYLESERNRTAQELESARQTLDTYVHNLNEKNKLIDQFSEQINTLQSEQGGAVQDTDHVRDLLNANILTEEGWAEFKLLFDKVHQGFFIRLRTKYPELTESEIRLLALTRLNISTRDMAAMIGISPESIHKTRYRLRKKLGLPVDGWEDLLASI